MSLLTMLIGLGVSPYRFGADNPVSTWVVLPVLLILQGAFLWFRYYSRSQPTKAALVELLPWLGVFAAAGIDEYLSMYHSADNPRITWMVSAAGSLGLMIGWIKCLYRSPGTKPQVLNLLLAATVMSVCIILENVYRLLHK